MSTNPLFHVYIAAPFFNPEQSRLVTEIEGLLEKHRANPVGGSVSKLSLYGEWRKYATYFSPRLGENALEMNKILSQGKQPPQELKAAVFRDNVEHLQLASLVIAVIDDRDSGTIWEMGYLAGHHGVYKMDRPLLLTVTGNNYGMNLMLALSIDGHCKGTQRLDEALTRVFNELKDYGMTMSAVRPMLKQEFLREVDLLEGPAERK